MLTDKLNQNEAVVCVVGLGYVGLPLAIEFSKSLRVIGYEIDEDKIKRLNNSESNRKNKNLFITNDPAKIRDADFVIISVPTPVTRSQEPDLGYVESAAEMISENLKQGSVVILESTVYSGVTEEIIKPILERSGLRCGEDFKVAYSPERLNPNFLRKNLVKPSDIPLRSSQIIVSGMDEETTGIVSKLYARITTVYAAKDIRTAEAAKVTPNLQRNFLRKNLVKPSDIPLRSSQIIARVNELSIIFEKMGLNTGDVLDAASTKWNFHRYSPGLVGGHCIPVDPYYLVYRAKELGYHPQVILAGRAINDYMPKHVVEIAVKALNEVGKAIKKTFHKSFIKNCPSGGVCFYDFPYVKNSRVLIMGLTYKENVARRLCRQ